jgi:cardiolipin synthase
LRETGRSRSLPQPFVWRVMSDIFTHPWVDYLLALSGVLLALLAVARLLGGKHQPANTLAWLLAILLVPWAGALLFLLFGGRKIRRLARAKAALLPVLPGAEPPAGRSAGRPVAQAVAAAGAPPPVGGNTLRVIADGQEMFAAMEENIRAARRCIHVTTFILGRDDTGRRLIRLLTARAREGVKVRLLLDAVGCMFLSRDFLRPLTRAGGEVAWFMPVLHFATRGSANLRNHRKIAVFDHATAIAGGHNLARNYFGPQPWKKRWRDFSAVVTGPAAAQLHEIFVADWCFATGQPPEALRAGLDPSAACAGRGDAELQVVASGPDVPGDPLYEGILAMIQEAQRSVTIITPYFIPDEVLMRSLVAKARAGRRVTLLVPAKPDHLLTELARRQALRELHAAGAEVRLVGPGMMHSKGLLTDDRLALFGSANLDPRSLFLNFEVGVLVHSCPEVAAMRAWADGLRAASQPYRPEPPRGFAPLRELAEDVARLLAPLL